MSQEDDTYSTIFTALKHPIRRKILRRLQASPATYTELLNELSIENGLLNYHLESIRELITKQEDGKYTLNEFGRAGVQLLQRVEEPVTSTSKGSTPRQSIVLKVMGIALIIILSFSTLSLYFSNQNLRISLDEQTSKVNAIQLYLLTLDQAISAIKSSGKADPSGNIIKGENLVSAELRYESIDWQKELSDSGYHSRIYVNQAPVGVYKPYWFISYDGPKGFHQAWTGNYIIDALTGELMLALEARPGPPGPYDYSLIFSARAL